MTRSVGPQFSNGSARVRKAICLKRRSNWTSCFLVSIGKAMGAPDGISHIDDPTMLCHWLLDREVFGYDTNADTITLINLILDDEKLGRAPALRNAVDWPLRRFNPPFAQIVQAIPDGRVSRPMQPDYPAMAVLITAEDKVLLRKLRSSFGGSSVSPGN